MKSSQTLDLREKLQDQQEEIQSLRDQLAVRARLTFDISTNVYRDADSAPYCPKCFDGDEKACRMHDAKDVWTCITCNRRIFKPGYPKPARKRQQRDGRSWMSEY